jgi:hypothetical protein
VGLRYIGIDGDVYVGGDMKFEKLFLGGIEMNEDTYIPEHHDLTAINQPSYICITSFTIIGTQPRYLGCHFGNTPIYRTRASREAAINSCSHHVDVAL